MTGQRKFSFYSEKDFCPKLYVPLCIAVFLISFLRIQSPVALGASLYRYDYGFFSPWIVIYKNSAPGLIGLLSCFLAEGYRGIEFFPQYLFLDTGVLYLLGVAVAKLRRKF